MRKPCCSWGSGAQHFCQAWQQSQASTHHPKLLQHPTGAPGRAADSSGDVFWGRLPALNADPSRSEPCRAPCDAWAVAGAVLWGAAMAGGAALLLLLLLLPVAAAEPPEAGDDGDWEEEAVAEPRGGRVLPGEAGRGLGAAGLELPGLPEPGWEPWGSTSTRREQQDPAHSQDMARWLLASLGGLLWDF